MLAHVWPGCAAWLSVRGAALRVKHSQPCEPRGSFLLLLGRRKLLPAVEGRGVEWETLAREDGCRDVALLSKHLLVTGDKEPLSLLWQLLWWPCELSVMLLPLPSLPEWCLCTVWWPWWGRKGPSPG